MKNPNHPIWGIIRLAVLMVSLVIVLWMNATNFDETELRSIVIVFLVAAGSEGAVKLFQRGD